MCLNFDEYHAKCARNLVTAPQDSKCLHELMPPYFIRIYHLYDPIKCEYGKINYFWVPYPLITKFMSPSQPRELVGW